VRGLPGSPCAAGEAQPLQPGEERLRKRGATLQYRDRSTRLGAR
jgi:hypothetical protein